MSLELIYLIALRVIVSQPTSYYLAYIPHNLRDFPVLFLFFLGLMPRSSNSSGMCLDQN